LLQTSCYAAVASANVHIKVRGIAGPTQGHRRRQDHARGTRLPARHGTAMPVCHPAALLAWSAQMRRPSASRARKRIRRRAAVRT